MQRCSQGLSSLSKAFSKQEEKGSRLLRALIPGDGVQMGWDHVADPPLLQEASLCAVSHVVEQRPESVC